MSSCLSRVTVKQLGRDSIQVQLVSLLLLFMNAMTCAVRGQKNNLIIFGANESGDDEPESRCQEIFKHLEERPRISECLYSAVYR